MMILCVLLPKLVAKGKHMLHVLIQRFDCIDKMALYVVEIDLVYVLWIAFEQFAHTVFELDHESDEAGEIKFIS